METKKLFQKVSLNILKAGHEFLGEKWNYKNFSQKFIRIYLIKQGKGIIRYPDKDIVLEPEKFYLIPPFKSADHFVLEEPLEQYYIHFYAKFDNNISILSLMDFYDSVFPTAPDVITYLFERFNKIYLGADDFMQLEADLILRYLISLLRKETVSKNVENAMCNIKRFEPVLAYLENNFAKKTSLKDMAGLVHLHPNYFSTAFTKVFGHSPIEFVIFKRLEKAQELLFFTNFSIKEISLMVGFNDEFHFSRIFKKYLDIPPAKYRNQRKAITPA